MIWFDEPSAILKRHSAFDKNHYANFCGSGAARRARGMNPTF